MLIVTGVINVLLGVKFDDLSIKPFWELLFEDSEEVYSRNLFVVCHCYH